MSFVVLQKKCVSRFQQLGGLNDERKEKLKHSKSWHQQWACRIGHVYACLVAPSPEIDCIERAMNFSGVLERLSSLDACMGLPF